MEIARTKQDVSSSSHSSKHFPTEILLNILSRVPAKSLFRFRCVSKLFCKLINDSSLAAMHLHHTDMIVEPSLVMVHSRTITSRGPALLCNPLRGKAIELPHCNVNALYPWEEWYGLGVDATSSTYQIVNVVFRIDRSYVVHVHVLGTSSWKQISAVPPCGLSKQNAFAHGNTYWLIGLIGEHILSFDFNDEKFIWIPHPNLPSNRVLHLFNLRGSLAIVDATSVLVTEVEVWVLKSDDTKECWVKDYNIKLNAGPCHCNEWWPLNCFVLVDDSSSRKCIVGVLRYNLRWGSRKRFRYGNGRVEGNFVPKIFSYTGSLVSLKDYSKLLVEGSKAEQSKAWLSGNAIS